MNFEFFERLIDYSFACAFAIDWELQDFFSLLQEALVVDGDLHSWVCNIILVLVFMHLFALYIFPFQLKQIIFLQPERNEKIVQ